MRNRIIVTVIVLTAVLAFSTAAWAQAGGGRPQGGPETREGAGANPNVRDLVPSIPPPEGWGNCPRCQNNTDRAKARQQYKVEGHAFNPKDISGVWGWDGVGNAFNQRTMPAMTEWGKKQYEATIGDKAPDGTPLHSKDRSGRGAGSKINCDPFGWPRLHTYNYGMEFVTLPDRVLQFFELNHTFRTIWTDGRKLPAEPPEPHWLGWNIGRWEGDTFVVESSGYDDRSWIIARNPDGGWVHSDEMKIVERYRRTSYGTLEAEMTITDPKTYVAPIVAPKAQIMLVPGAEIWENFCVPSDYGDFNEKVFGNAAGTAPR
jgi:hypothetical protein